MYEIGQLIVYGNEGVCRVEEIGTPKISGVDKHRDYYTLAPIYREGKVFTPVDSKVFMRPVITREEALALIDRIPQMTAEVYENSNLRFLNEHYQQCIQNYTCADLLQLIKDVRAKRRQMTERGKKLGLVDERYMKRAEEMLHGGAGRRAEHDARAGAAVHCRRTRRRGRVRGCPRLNLNPKSRRTQCPAGFLHFALDRRANCVYATA